MTSAPPVADGNFHIRPAWPDQLAYQSEAGQEIRFDCRAMQEPPQVLVPLPPRWAEQLPAWAHGQRELIVARLRGANCVVLDQGDDVTLAISPCYTLRVEQHRGQDDRGHWEAVSVVALPSQQTLAHINTHGASQWLAFPGPGLAAIAVTNRAGQHLRLQIDAARRTFRFLPDGIDEPLDQLPARLGRVPQRLASMQTPARSATAKLLGGLLAAGSVVLCGGGVWMGLSADTAKDRWTGWFGALFFGAGVVMPLWGWLKQRR
ncbi:MAG: hypothetical protein HY021_04535 [Burkholderiales bacterium]|nr:hypothetical protein [Burkholderiales bacterium]